MASSHEIISDMLEIRKRVEKRDRDIILLGDSAATKLNLSGKLMCLSSDFCTDQ